MERALGALGEANRAPWLIGVAFGLLLLGWVFGMPPGGAPDEPQHYIRAVGISTGDLAGSPETDRPWRDWGADHERYVNATTRMVRVPAGLAPDQFGCNRFAPEKSAACADDASSNPASAVLPTYVGAYAPFPYLLPALTIRFEDEARPALLAGRIAAALLVWVLLVTASFLVIGDRPSCISVFGLLLAVTPMAMFAGASLAPSGLEIAAAICWWSALARVSRPEPAGWPAPAALTGAGMALALARPIGPAWVVLAIATTAAYVGPERWRTLLRSDRRYLAALIATVLAAAATLAWSAVFIHAGAIFDTSRFWGWVVAAVRVIPDILNQEIGVFGWLDTPLPPLLYLAWEAMVAAIVVGSLLVARERRTLVVLCLLVVALLLPVAISVFVISPAGWPNGIQGRYFLPIVAGVPILAAEPLASRLRLRLAVQQAAGLCASLAIAGSQLAAWWIFARRNAVGVDGPLWFLAQPEWTPPAGWGPWVVVATLGSVLIVAAAATAARQAETAAGD
jgi:hypothetical protein